MSSSPSLPARGPDRQKKKNSDLRNSQAQPQQGQTATCLGDSRDTHLVSWFERWRVPMQRWIASNSLVPAADLDDVAQETFLRVIRYSGNVAVEYPQTYLFRIAANVASEWRERARNSRPHNDTWLEDLQIEAGDEPQNAIARTLVNKHVRTAMQRLPQRQRQVLLLHVDDNLTYVQIAEQLGLTRRIVKRDLALAYRQLKSELDADDLED